LPSTFHTFPCYQFTAIEHYAVVDHYVWKEPRINSKILTFINFMINLQHHMQMNGYSSFSTCSLIMMNKCQNKAETTFISVSVVNVERVNVARLLNVEPLNQPVPVEIKHPQNSSRQK
ncbi:hypothetical protein T4E_5630, partial [Trichinella pseudospiralis]